MMMTDDPYSKVLLDQSANILCGVRQGIDEYLLEFFGSKENAERYGHLYILEQHPYQFETEHIDKNLMRIRATTTYRLRFKTKEELRDSSQ